MPLTATWVWLGCAVRCRAGPIGNNDVIRGVGRSTSQAVGPISSKEI
jgi:hypothetical protein